MELVRGVPITDYCDQHRLTAAATGWSCSCTVCRAVQHAHQKGVIHRDLKPSNVLVTLHDGGAGAEGDRLRRSPRRSAQPLTDKTLFTGFAQLVGTPLYMSPEQAELSGLDVDTRSDVYSLGRAAVRAADRDDAVRPGAAAGRPGSTRCGGSSARRSRRGRARG